MIQDIMPYVFKNEFYDEKPSSKNYFLYYRDGKILLKNDGEVLKFAQYCDFEHSYPDLYACSDYLFSLIENK